MCVFLSRFGSEGWGAAPCFSWTWARAAPYCVCLSRRDFTGAVARFSTTLPDSGRSPARSFSADIQHRGSGDLYPQTHPDLPPPHPPPPYRTYGCVLWWWGWSCRRTAGWRGSSCSPSWFSSLFFSPGPGLGPGPVGSVELAYRGAAAAEREGGGEEERGGREGWGDREREGGGEKGGREGERERRAGGAAAASVRYRHRTAFRARARRAGSVVPLTTSSASVWPEPWPSTAHAQEGSNSFVLVIVPRSGSLVQTSDGQTKLWIVIKNSSLLF